jgi:MarR family transcriptional repressor of mepA
MRMSGACHPGRRHPAGCKRDICHIPKVIAAQLHRVDNLVFRQMNELSRANGVEDITAMHGWILNYLYQNREQQVFQRDIERSFTITRGTVTSTLQLMEKKGYIRRESVPEDARLKRIVITDAGAQAHEKIVETLRQTNACLDGMLTPEERGELLRLLEKLQTGLAAKLLQTKQPTEGAIHD